MSQLSPYIEHRSVSDDDLLRMIIMNKTVVSERGCWEWLGAKRSTGYATIMRNRKVMFVHRLSYGLWHQPIPSGMVIRHECDNPRCVNPNHLIVGTQADNMRDKVERGRHTGAHLTPAQVLEIRSSNEPTIVLASRFGVGVMSINRARRGATWAHLKDGKRSIGKGYSASTGSAPLSKITSLEAEAIRASRLSAKLLASIFGISRKSIENIRNGVTWKSLTQNRGVLFGAS